MSSPVTLATALTDILNGISTVIDSVARYRRQRLSDRWTPCSWSSGYRCGNRWS